MDFCHFDHHSLPFGHQGHHFDHHSLLFGHQGFHFAHHSRPFGHRHHGLSKVEGDSWKSVVGDSIVWKGLAMMVLVLTRMGNVYNVHMTNMVCVSLAFHFLTHIVNQVSNSALLYDT